MFRFKVSLLLMVCACFVTACTDNNSYEALNHSKSESDMQAKRIDTEFLTTVVHEVTLSAIGDLLIHDTVYQDAFNGATYNFNPMLDNVTPYLQQSTITMANQETMIGGMDIGLSSYPAFNSPKSMGDALVDAGIDVVTIANNHTLDRGEPAIQSAISYWGKIDMMYTGAFKSWKDQQKIRVLQTDQDISVAFLAYTYGTNGIPVPDGKTYLVNLIDKQKMAADIAKAKKRSDVIVLSLHFGKQYERMPNERQKELVQFAADQGVQVVIGHHPHVLQPVDWVEGKDGNETFVAYSLGNFLSGQDEFYNCIGGMVRITIRKTVTEGAEDEIEIVSPEFLPTFVDFQPGETDFEGIPMYQLTNDILPNAEEHYKKIKAHLSQWVPGLTFIEK